MMENAVALQPGNADIISSLVINGDLSKLTAVQQVQYYNQFCQSLGLNPLTKPFDLLVLNNKKVLYANKNCAEQLRQNHGVSTIEMNSQTINDVFIVTVKVQNSAGRIDIATGAVPIKGLSGNELANAMMKTETKAKRRATLSLCSIGVLDETELDTIPDASKVAMPEINVTHSATEYPAQSTKPANEETNHPISNSDPVCTVCGKPLLKSKPEYGGGWYCYAKKGGCGKKFTDEEIKNPQESEKSVEQKAGAPIASPKLMDDTISQAVTIMDKMKMSNVIQLAKFKWGESVGDKMFLDKLQSDYEAFLKKEIVEENKVDALPY